MPRIFAVILVVLCAVAPSALRATATPAQESLDPTSVITLADVQAVLGGKFGVRPIEPGVVFYEEIGGPRVVDVSLWWASQSQVVTDLKAQLQAEQALVEDIPGFVGTGIYRPREYNAIFEKPNPAGDRQWLEIRVHNVEGPSAAADTKRFAIELVRRAAAKM